MKDKTLKEKVALLNETQMPHRAPFRLNDDGTLSVHWGPDDMREKSCPCGFIKRLPDSFEIPLTFCAHFLLNSKYKMADTPDLEVNTEIGKNDYNCEIWIPAVEKNI